MMEIVGVILLAIGMLLTLVAVIWIDVLAFRTRWWWGLLVVLIPPAWIVYCVLHYRRVFVPLSLFAAGVFCLAVPLAVSNVDVLVAKYQGRRVVVDGEVHLNLTDWARGDYSILSHSPDVAVLELANANVTDDTLRLLKAMPLLKELTLNDTAITDQGLATLAELPRLESLRLERTKISAEGLANFLEQAPPTFKNINTSGTGLPTSVLRKWKNKAPAERKYVN